MRYENCHTFLSKRQWILSPHPMQGIFPLSYFKRVASHESYPMNLIGMMTYGDFDMTVKKRSARSVEDFYEKSEIYMILS